MRQPPSCRGVGRRQQRAARSRAGRWARGWPSGEVVDLEAVAVAAARQVRPPSRARTAAGRGGDDAVLRPMSMTWLSPAVTTARCRRHNTGGGPRGRTAAGRCGGLAGPFGDDGRPTRSSRRTDDLHVRSARRPRRCRRASRAARSGPRSTMPSGSALDVALRWSSASRLNSRLDRPSRRLSRRARSRRTAGTGPGSAALASQHRRRARRPRGAGRRESPCVSPVGGANLGRPW